MSTAELLKKVRKIEILAKGKSREVMAGAYHAAFRGRGMTFSETREYQAGDDVRDIDWNVTARTHVPHVKLYEEEKEITVVLMIDTSASGFFGSTVARVNYIAEIAALLAYNAIRQQNRLGAIFFSDKVDLYIPPAKGKKQMLRIIREMVASTAGKGGNGIEMALRNLTSIQNKRTVCFIISDFIQDHYEIPLVLASKKHDIIPIRIWDGIEKKCPETGLIRCFDAEQNKWIWFDTEAITETTEWHQYFQNFELYFEQAVKAAGIKGLTLQNGNDYLPALLQYFRKR
ncbi:MAG: DUF58 domain-containing protein [Saprospiraceae bacterium]|nr:DUF58 domain-containing protein [Saprospiraceae bacterium]